MDAVHVFHNKVQVHNFTKCVLDSSGCIDLSSIVNIFNSSISEQQAWAILFQASKTCSNLLKRNIALFLTTELKHILIKKDGTISEATFTAQSVTISQRRSNSSRVRAMTETELVSCLGNAVYKALDFGCSEEEERDLSLPLSELLEFIISDDEGVERPETDDEGIERDSGESEDELGNNSCTFQYIIQVCAQQLQLNLNAADVHYANICRAYVSDALELSASWALFRAGLDDQTESHQCSEELIKSWMDVMHQLRCGVRLRHVELREKEPLTFDLTPYEALMEDIKKKRYCLNKVEPVSLKKDPHAALLEVIRARPLLRKASERSLKDRPPQPVSVVEKLMESIRTHDVKRLRRSPLKDWSSLPKIGPKKIECDLRLFEDDSDDSDSYLYQSEDIKRHERKNGQCMLLRPSELENSWYNSRFQDLRRHSAMPSLGHSSSISGPRLSFHNEVFQNRRGSLLHLTLPEVVHIRTTLTRAEIEKKLDPSIRQELLKGKICYSCKVRFGLLFGPWAQQCHLCKQKVCSKCSFRANIPDTNFPQLPERNLVPKCGALPSIASEGPASLDSGLKLGESSHSVVDDGTCGPSSFAGLGAHDLRWNRRFTVSKSHFIQMSVVCRECRGLLHDLIASAN
ncbi:protein spire homolog 1-like isoform X2 [Artemia franciscana]|uniref:KIND domain-containing protein n=1 Tax=Artemia franciscana TaxID=6661 RepID=A0AA88HNL6_ARTSF|nr:hypothetical protein QYM36_014474 [Artemia franciscana]